MRRSPSGTSAHGRTTSLRGGRRVPFGTMPSLDLAGEPAFALGVPALGEDRIVLGDQIERRLVRRMAGAERKPRQPRRLGIVADMIGEIADALVDQIGRQVIAGGEGARRIDRRVVAHQLGRVLVGLGVHEAVEAVEAAAERPAVERAGSAQFGERRHMPLAQHVVAIAVRAQHLGDGPGLARDLAAIARIARIEVGQAADADRMMVAARQQRRSRGRAHRRRMKAGVAQAASGDGVDDGGGDGRAVAAEIGEADIVEQDDQDVGGAFGRFGASGQCGWDSATVAPILPAMRFLFVVATLSDTSSSAINL